MWKLNGTNSLYILNLKETWPAYDQKLVWSYNPR